MNSFRSQQGRSALRVDILPPEPGRARPVRMTQPRRDVVDAQFVSLPPGLRGQAARSHNDNHRKAEPRPSAFRAALAQGEEALRSLPADLFSAFVAAIFVAVFTFAGGFSFLFAGDAKPPVTGLELTHVSMTPQDANGMRVLLINGIIENRGAGSIAVPSIRADLVANEVVTASTLIGPPVPAIAGGKSRGFTARVPYAGGKLPDLRLSFAEQDASSL